MFLFGAIFIVVTCEIFYAVLDITMNVFNCSIIIYGIPEELFLLLQVNKSRQRTELI